MEEKPDILNRASWYEGDQPTNDDIDALITAMEKRREQQRAAREKSLKERSKNKRALLSPIFDNPGDFEQHRAVFVSERKEHWKRRIEQVIDEWQWVEFPQHTSESLTNAAQLLSQFELGADLVFARYDKNQLRDDGKVIGFFASQSAAGNTPPETMADWIFYLRETESIYCNMQWLLSMAKDPKSWFDKTTEEYGRTFGAVPLASFEDQILFAGIEEASHKLYLASRPLDEEQENPEHGEYYYAKAWEFQALKTQTYFARKFFPEVYGPRFSGKLNQIVEYRKNSKKLSDVK